MLEVWFQDKSAAT